MLPSHHTAHNNIRAPPLYAHMLVRSCEFHLQLRPSCPARPVRRPMTCAFQHAGACVYAIGVCCCVVPITTLGAQLRAVHLVSRWVHHRKLHLTGPLEGVFGHASKDIYTTLPEISWVTPCMLSRSGESRGSPSFRHMRRRHRHGMPSTCWHGSAAAAEDNWGLTGGRKDGCKRVP